MLFHSRYRLLPPGSLSLYDLNGLNDFYDFYDFDVGWKIGRGQAGNLTSHIGSFEFLTEGARNDE